MTITAGLIIISAAILGIILYFKIKNELGLKEQSVTNLIKGLDQKLKDYEEMVRRFEKDRDIKYGGLANQLKTTAEATNRLQQVTDKLGNILGNVKLRGQWGEKIAEDILMHAGLIEGVHYLKNKKQDTTLTRPDYTFLLPNDYKVNMDVKFPLNRYLLYKNTETEKEEERKQHKREFIRDVKNRIKEIQNRDYINPSENTLDFVLLFVPNEQVYAFIHMCSPGLIDEALKQKVILCSPFTLYAVLKIIRQAHDNFHFSKATKEIIKLIGEFEKSYLKFKNRFTELGERLKKTTDKYEEITTKSYKALDSKVNKIEAYKKGQGLNDQLIADTDHDRITNGKPNKLKP